MMLSLSLSLSLSFSLSLLSVLDPFYGISLSLSPFFPSHSLTRSLSLSLSLSHSLSLSDATHPQNPARA